MLPKSTRHVYHVSPWRQGVLIGVWLLLAGPMAVGGLLLNDAALWVVASIMTAIFAPVLWLVCRYTRLIVSEQGVELVQAGFRLTVAWENVERLWIEKGSEGLLLREALTGPPADRLARFAQSRLLFSGVPLEFYQGPQREWISQRRFIPIEPFAWWLTHGNLRQDILRFAPDLEDATPQEFAAPSPPAKRVPPSRKVLVVVTIIVCLTIGVLMGSHVLPPNVEAGLAQVLRGLLAIGIGAYAAVNGWSTITHLRHGRSGAALLPFVFFVLQVLFVLLIIAS